MNEGNSTRLAVDIGGTFTDVVLWKDDQLYSTKVLTTPDDPSEGFFIGVTEILGQANTAAADIDLVIHGTTLATNALIERRGALTGLLTTEGHRDILEMAYENRFDQYDINADRRAPLVPRYLRAPIRERMNFKGEPLRPLHDDEVRAATDRLLAEGVESVAIGFLHSYANGAHETRAAEIVRETAPGLSITLSSEVCPEVREYDRLSTACANAYVRPLMESYLRKVETGLSDRGFRCSLLLMSSGGGLTTLENACQFPIRLVESGPAGGAILAAAIAKEHNLPSVISFDMGGTTAKICLIDDFEPQTARAFEVDRAYRFKKGSGLPVRIPVIEMVEIGAGGGSIAHNDDLGRIQIGPESAGADPGPACYDRGGKNPTVTDANLLLGKLVKERFACGAIPLNEEAARRVISNEIAVSRQISERDAAQAISDIVEDNMAGAARAHANEWGVDVAGRTLIAFGGAAPLHAGGLAQKLDADRIVIPAGAGVGSAIGFLIAPISYEVIRSRRMSVGNFDPEIALNIIEDMRAEAKPVVTVAAPGGTFTEECRVYMRYQGQGHEIAVAPPADALLDRSGAGVRSAFE
ncbi:MAG: hydantoinase/oxoprolinase family protein, partial [Pseudomonadota bacterium]